MSRNTTSFVYVTYILSSANKVFEAITRPEITAQYWGFRNVSDWQPGAEWRHIKAKGDGQPTIMGKVVLAEPPHRMVLSWANPADLDKPETHSRVTFEIEPYDDMVRLTVIHDELDPDSGMAKGITKGWPIVLSSLKSYLESGRAIDVFAKPKAA